MRIQAENTASVAAETVETKAQLQIALARISELEAALNNIIDKTGRAHPMSYVADIWRIARAALAGGKDE